MLIILYYILIYGKKQAKKLINMLWEVKDAYLFHQPVDQIELGIPDYFQIIKNPTDFSTIKKKLSNKLRFIRF